MHEVALRRVRCSADLPAARRHEHGAGLHLDTYAHVIDALYGKRS